MKNRLRLLMIAIAEALVANKPVLPVDAAEDAEKSHEWPPSSSLHFHYRREIVRIQGGGTRRSRKNGSAAVARWQPRRRFWRQTALLAAVLWLIPALPLRAESAAGIVSGYLRASGMARAHVRSALLEGQITDDRTGETGPYTLIEQAPDKFYVEVHLGPRESAEACDGFSCWQKAPGGEPQSLFGARERLLLALGRYLNTGFLDRKALHLQLVQTQSSGTPAVLLTSGAGIDREAFFDPRTRALSAEIATDGGEPYLAAWPSGTASNRADSTVRSSARIVYSDYRRVDGVAKPFRIHIQQNGGEWTIEFSRIGLNSPVNVSAFAFPAYSKKALPAIPALLADVQRNQRAVDEAREKYTFTDVEEQVHLGGHGRISKSTVSEYDEFFMHGHLIRRLVKRDGKALSPDAQKREDRRVRKLVGKYEREAQQAKAPPEDEVGISTFLRTSRFTHPRWERFEGRDVIVFDFEPDPAYHPKTLTERIAHGLDGVVWVDAQSREIIRLQAWFNNSLKIGGGLLASVEKGTSLTAEQAWVDSEVWLPSYMEFHAGARLLLFKGLQLNVTDRFSNYRVFHVQGVTHPSQASRSLR